MCIMQLINSCKYYCVSVAGDWNISILYEGQHIQGSPFSVRVYDAAQVKVFGLEGGSVGRMFSFSGQCFKTRKAEKISKLGIGSHKKKYLSRNSIKIIIISRLMSTLNAEVL